MSYSWYIIGERIRKNRKEKGLSQDNLAELLEQKANKPIKRQTVAGWENGKPVKKLEQITALCEIFDCDVAYLLCECDSKRLASQPISQTTGLSESAVDYLITLKRQNLTGLPYLSTVSELISQMMRAEEKGSDRCLLQYLTYFLQTDYFPHNRGDKDGTLQDRDYDADWGALIRELTRFTNEYRHKKFSTD